MKYFVTVIQKKAEDSYSNSIFRYDTLDAAKVKAYLSDANSHAWFSNSAGQSDITTTNTTFWLYKWGSDYQAAQ